MKNALFEEEGLTSRSKFSYSELKNMVIDILKKETADRSIDDIGKLILRSSSTSIYFCFERYFCFVF